ncbi:unnamed protein product, partial [marine sediment metagenome]
PTSQQVKINPEIGFEQESPPPEPSKQIDKH